MSATPLVDVIIPIHDASRPLARSLDSLRESGMNIGADVVITVVCHNISSSEITANLSTETRESAQFLEFWDNVPSPAGPRTFALAQTSGKFVSFLDSDDTFDAGALRDWVSRAESNGLDAVIPPERHATGRAIRTPVVRPFHSGDLDPVRDRLSYRTAPLGLIRRSAIEKLQLKFGLDVRNGSDQIFGLKLWFGTSRVRFARGGPGYVVGADATTRVTTQLQRLASELKATSDLLTDSWYRGLSLPKRRAIVVKFVRVQFFGAVQRRFETGTWDAESAIDAQAFLQDAELAAPGYQRSLSIADVRLCQALIQQLADAKLAHLSRERRKFGRPATLVTHDLRGIFLPDAPIRFMAATLLH